LNIDGAKTVRLTAKGELEVDTGAGSLRFTKPVASQELDGRRTAVDVAYTVKGSAYGFQLAAYDKTKELVIDPLIDAYFINKEDGKTWPTCMAADSQGNIYIGARSAGQNAVFKLDSKLEELQTSALFGSIPPWRNDRYPSVYGIAVDGQDNIYLAGITEDKDFPVTEGAFDTVFDPVYPQRDGFITKFNSDLNQLLASTYIGGDDIDRGYGVAIDSNDTVYVVGQTANPVSDFNPDATPFPTTAGAYDTTPGDYGDSKAFVARLDSGLQTLLAATLLGHDRVIAYAVAVDVEGAIVVAGVTHLANFPLTDNCADAEFQGEKEAFVSKFDPELRNLLASTLLGGLNDERPNAVAVDADNEIFVAGWTLSSDFPVVQDSFDTSYHLYEDGFVSRLSSDLTTISASAFIGGLGPDQVHDIVVQDDGTVVLGGGTASPDFPTTADYHDASYNGGSGNHSNHGDGFVMKLDNDLKTCEASTFLGGGNNDYVSSVLVNSKDIVATGPTGSADFPYVIENIGYTDTFVCRFNEHETPKPLPSAGPGYWESSHSGSDATIYLNVNICADGSFSGAWRSYVCNLGPIVVDCRTTDSFPPNPVSGHIDFENNSGTINIDEKCQDTPFEIIKQTPEKLVIGINRGEEITNCLGSMRSFLNSKGDSEDGACEETSGEEGQEEDREEGEGPSPEDSDGGGGGGCFINSMNDLF
jgi:hypothetical protein